ELRELDQVADSTSALGLGKRLLELGQRRGEVAAGERHLTARGEDLEIHLEKSHKARVLAGALERGFSRVLIVERQLRLGEQRQSLGRLSTPVVDGRRGGPAGRAAEEVLGRRPRLSNVISRVGIRVLLEVDLRELPEHPRHPHRGAPAVRVDGGSRVGQALLVPLPRLGAIAGVAIRIAQHAVDRHHHAHLVVGDGRLVPQQIEGLLRRRDGLLELVEANRHERRAGVVGVAGDGPGRPRRCPNCAAAGVTNASVIEHSSAGARSRWAIGTTRSWLDQGRRRNVRMSRNVRVLRCWSCLGGPARSSGCCWFWSWWSRYSPPCPISSGDRPYPALASPRACHASSVRSRRSPWSSKQLAGAPPPLEVAAATPYILPGGAGLVVVRAGDAVRADAKVGSLSFPTFPMGPQGTRVGFFALPYDIPSGTSLSVTAADEAGNAVTRGIPAEMLPRRFRRDTIEVSDAFLNAKVPELLPQRPPNQPLVEGFLVINRDQRKFAEEQKRRVALKTADKPLWEGRSEERRGGK